MAITPTGDRNVFAAVTRAARVTWFGAPSTVNEAPPIALNNESLRVPNAAGTAYVNILRLDTSDQVRVGSGACAVKIFNRPTTDAFALQVKSEFTGTATGHNCLEVTADWKGAGAAGGGNTAVQGVSRLAATYTATGGSLIGTYGQACNLGTLNGSGIMVAGLYGLLEDGGTWTAVSHAAAGWFDSHLAQTVTAGSKELLYLTNNGATTLDSVFFIYPGNKITNLFTIDATNTGLLTTGGNEPTWTGKTCLINAKIGTNTSIRFVAVDVG
jgi:hypothetical protein